MTKATIRKVRRGAILKCEGIDPCIPLGASRMVFQDRKISGRAGLYVRCKDGRHYLDGQISEDGKSYVGFVLASRQRY